MKYTKFVVVLLVFSSLIVAQKKDKKMFDLKVFEDSVSYSIGQNIGTNLKDPTMKINFPAVIAGMQDAMAGKSSLTPEQMQKCMALFNEKMMAVRNAQMEKENEAKKATLAPEIEKNTKEGNAYLAANKAKEGVITTASGLQYKIITKGTGTVSPTETSTVKVHYRGTFIDGKEFDSSYKRNQPAEFPLNQVIKGWTEGVQLMHVGDKYEFVIPFELAYGEMGREGGIPPASVLVFEVELLEIVK